MDGDWMLGLGLVAAALLLVGLRVVLRVLDAANGADWGHPALNRLDGLNRLFCRYYHRLDCDPPQLPAMGAAVVACNHVSGLDPLVMIAACGRPLRFLMAREEYERFGLQWLFRAVGCIPVDRDQRPARALREARRLMADGEVVALFPHGRIHLDRELPRRLKPGVAKLAQLTGAPIVPMRLDGVRGEGQTLLAVFRRSRVRLRSFPPLDCTELSSSDCLGRLQPLLEATERGPG